MYWLVSVVIKEPGQNETPPVGEKTLEKSNFSGKVEKVPFVSGSSLTVHELKADLSQTGKSFATTLKNHKGEFEIKKLELASPFVQLKVDGFFFDEVRGSLSKAKITLYALSSIKRCFLGR